MTAKAKTKPSDAERYILLVTRAELPSNLGEVDRLREKGVVIERQYVTYREGDELPAEHLTDDVRDRWLARGAIASVADLDARREHDAAVGDLDRQRADREQAQVERVQASAKAAYERGRQAPGGA